MRSAATVSTWAMRAFSVASRAAISASSTACPRAISRRRVSSSLAMRASVSTRSCASRAFSTASRAAISASSTTRTRSISCARTSRSLAMRAVSMARWLAMRAFSISSRARISRSSTARVRSISLCRVSRSEAMRACAMAFSLLMRARSIASREAITACSASVSRSARSRATSVRCRARRMSMSRSCSSRAVSLSRSMSSACRSASRLRVRIRIIESCSMSLRSLRLASMSSISRVRPSASKRFDGLKNSRSVWSRSVIATDSSSRPFCASASAAACLSARDIFAALLVHLLHRHFGGDGAQRRDELARQQRVQFLGLQRAAAERGCGDGDRLAGRLHADVEIGLDVDAHAVAGDDGVLLGARDRHRQHVHVDRRVVVDERQHEGAAVDDDALAEEAGADERHLLGRTVVQPVDDIDDDDNGDDGDNEPQDQLANQCPRHDHSPLKTPPLTGRGSP